MEEEKVTKTERVRPRKQLPLIPVPLIQAGLHLGWVSPYRVPYACLLVGSCLWFLSLESPPPTTSRRHQPPISSDAPIPTLRPKFLGLGNQNTFAPASSHFFLPDARAPSLFQHRLSDSQLQLITLSVAGPES